MNVDSAHKNNWEIAEVVFGVPFLVSIALHFVVPFSFSQRIPRQVLIPVGIVLMIIGIGLISLGRREFAHFVKYPFYIPKINRQNQASC